MIFSKNTFKRARPILGTFFEIKVFTESAVDGAQTNYQLTEIFEIANQLESLFSIFNEDSDTNRLNRASPGDRLLVSKYFFELFQLALKIEEFSEKSFNCFLLEHSLTDNNQICRHASSQDLVQNNFNFFSEAGKFWIQKNNAGTIDLNGIAKGYIVDHTAAELAQRLPLFSGIINAGGDLRFVNETYRETNLRLGAMAFPKYQKLISPFDSVATSSFTVSQNNPHSKTSYIKRLRPPLDELSTITVLGPNCAVADSITKVALFASKKVIEKCADYFNLQILAFDRHGVLIESYGSL